MTLPHDADGPSGRVHPPAVHTPSSFAQRAYSAALFAWASVGAYWLIASDERWAWSVASYTAGSVIGVAVLTHSREGVRLWPTAAGAVVGALPGVMVGLTADDPEGPSGGQLGFAVLFLFTAPLGAAAGHSIGS